MIDLSQEKKYILGKLFLDIYVRETVSRYNYSFEKENIYISEFFFNMRPVNLKQKDFLFR